MQSASQQSIPVSNPAKVMRMIESCSPEAGLATLVASQLPKTKPSQQPNSPHLRLHIDADAEAHELHGVDVLHQADPPARQVEQLIHHLHQQQKELAQREADLQAEVYQWEKQTLASDASLRRRTAELDQHLTQVQCQQEQLLKLHQELVDRQSAIRKVVERLVCSSSSIDLKAELETLQSELGDRFDHIFDRWQRVVQMLRR